MKLLDWGGGVSAIKVPMQGKLIAYVHIETISLWAEFVNKNICISARLVSEGIKTFNFDNFENSHDS